MNVYRLEAKTDLRRAALSLSALARVRVSATVAVLSMLGFFLYRPEITGAVFATGLGSFFLCAGCCALNQVQEKRTDGYFSRTVMRPLPQGRISSKMAALTAVLWIGLAVSLYSMTGSSQALIMALVVVAVFNGLYTGLKRRTPYALFVGGVAGAMPPLIGWIAADGSMYDPLILSNCVMWYLVQIPHLWIRVYKHKEEYISRFSPVPVSYFMLAHHTAFMRFWYFAYVCSIMMFALVCTWQLGVSSLVGTLLGCVLLFGSILPIAKLASAYLFDAISVCILVGAVLIQL